MSNDFGLLRTQIARIVGNDPRAVRAFELLFSQAQSVIPSNVQDVQISAGNAESMAAQALASIDRLADVLELLIVQPPYDCELDDLSPPVVIPSGMDVVQVSSATIISEAQFADVDATAGAVTITLQSPVGLNGSVCGVAKNDASVNAVTVSGAINGAASYSLPSQYDSKLFISVGAEWRAL